jgi:hypothetical protein
VKYVDLERSPCPPAKPPRARRDEGSFSEVIENKEVFSPKGGEANSLRNNDFTDGHSVAVNRGKGRWKHKRRLIPEAIAENSR